VIVVSHDRYFLNRVCTSILAFEGDGRVVYNVGNYDYYLEKRVVPAQAAESNSPPGIVAATRKGSSEKPRKFTWKEAREWESMESNILAAEDKVSQLEATFDAPDFYLKPRSEMLDLENQLKAARDKVSQLYERWHELELIKSAPSQ
jgi:ATP-binding cassette subfamily F protein uup